MKNERIRVVIRRKRLSNNILHKSINSQLHTVRQLTSAVEKRLKHCNKNGRKNKYTIVINYKPVFVHSQGQKRKANKVLKNDNYQGRIEAATLCSHQSNISEKSNEISEGVPVPMNIPDTEDPLTFIETMYRQLFTEDGKVRYGHESNIFTNCVKQFVTNSRRNSTSTNNLQRKRSSNYIQPTKPISLSSSCQSIFNTFIEEDESNTLLDINQTTNSSRRSSKQSNIDPIERQHEQLRVLLHSYHQQNQRIQSPTNQSRCQFSNDDTDNEELDTFSDMNSCRKVCRNSPPNISDDLTQTDSKLLLSSGYQSLKLSPPTNKKLNFEYNDKNSNEKLEVVKSKVSFIGIFQPIKDMFTKYLTFLVLSKNILLVPILIFLSREHLIFRHS